MRKCGKCGAFISDREDVCPYCGADYEEPAAIPEEQESQTWEPGSAGKQAGEHPMKWHKFLMITMIIGAVLTAMNGLGAISGTAYTSLGLNANEIYNVYPGAKSMDMLFGFAAICIGVFELYVRNQLNRFRRNAPMMLRILYISSLAYNVIYLQTVSSVLKVNAFDSSSLLMIGSTVASFIINTIYYSRRSDLFVN